MNLRRVSWTWPYIWVDLVRQIGSFSSSLLNERDSWEKVLFFPRPTGSVPLNYKCLNGPSIYTSLTSINLTKVDRSLTWLTSVLTSWLFRKEFVTSSVYLIRVWGEITTYLRSQIDRGKGYMEGLLVRVLKWLLRS